jgi:hypothetical protein
MERDSWTGPISPGSTLEIRNPHGDIRLRHGGSENIVEAAVVFQQIAIDGARLALDVAVGDGTAVITIVRLDYQGNPAKDVPRGDRARADLAVMVPEGFPLVAETDSGLLEVRGVKTDVDLRTGAGTIRVLGNSGRITTRSGSGVTEITLMPGVTKHPQHFASVTGPITVHISSNADLDIAMATSGAFITEFSLDVTHHDDSEPNKRATTIIGGGGPKLAIESKRGDLALRRVVTVGTD